MYISTTTYLISVTLHTLKAFDVLPANVSRNPLVRSLSKSLSLTRTRPLDHLRGSG